MVVTLVSSRIECDGEVFMVSLGAPGNYSYDWISGPNAQYGFSLAAHNSPPLETADHLANIRNFLEQIDPETGYIED
ncbi:hypothetical protein [Brachybacterium tyrofermentans]|uniref:hypothetical protein n=2 Tax=Brachybacterium tyrofermentans TaxID=47848 RepID=UPI00268912CA